MSAQGAVDVLANLLGATAAFVAGLAAGRFPLLSDVALLVLIPPTGVVIRDLASVVQLTEG